MNKLTLSEISKLDKENRQLINILHKARLRIGLELGQRLKRFRDEKLYSKLDSVAYPSFKSYLDSIDINYKSAMETIGLYESFVLIGGKKAEELENIGYHRLTIIKPHLFKKEGDGYKLIKPQRELDKWIKIAASDITQEDLKLLRTQEEVGAHVCEWQEFHFSVCKICREKRMLFNAQKK